MKFHRLIVLIAIALAATSLIAGPGQAATLNIASVGTYDEQVVDTNVVDLSAAGSINFATFVSDVATAYSNDFGGVIDFDISPEVRGIDRIEATYGVGHGKTLVITDGDPGSGSWRNRDSTGISGTRSLNKDNANIAQDDKTNDWNMIIDPSSSEKVVSMGMTYIAAGSGTFNVDVIATFNDSTTTTLSSAIDVSNTFNEDTFFGITAPAGRYITKFSVVVDPTPGLGNFGRWDDLGFITTAVPEPTSAMLVASLAVVGFLVRRHRVS